MIYICEYDGTIERQSLLEAAGRLPVELGLDYREGVRDGRRTEKMTEVYWKKYRERILAWLLLGHAVKAECGYSLAQLGIVRTEQGKPCSGSHPEIQFNISHCETACACVVGLEKCGIDIERKFLFRESLAKKVCHESEWKHFVESEDQRAVQLQILWSLKESYVKRDGRGLGYGMDRVSFAELMPFAAAGICPERALLWNCAETYTLAACLGRMDFAAADFSSGLRSAVCPVSEQSLVSRE